MDISYQRQYLNNEGSILEVRTIPKQWRYVLEPYLRNGGIILEPYLNNRCIISEPCLNNGGSKLEPYWNNGGCILEP